MRDSVAIIDDDNRKILFPVGKYFALKNFYKPDMSFIKVKFLLEKKLAFLKKKLPEQVETILCMAISPNRKFLAVSERIRNDPIPQISIYNIKNSQMKSEKEKTFRYSDSKSEVI
jgi:cilia- and flagella-associated protein 57